MPREYSEDLRWQVVYLESESYNAQEISKTLFIDKSTVNYILRTFAKWGCVINPFKGAPGCKKKFSRKELQVLQQLVKEKVDWYLDELLVEIENLTGKSASVSALWHSLHYHRLNTKESPYRKGI